MKITCSGCLKVYNIPDERLKFGERISFPCPACTSIIEIDLRSKSKSQAPPSPFQISREKQKIESPHESSTQELLSGEALKNKILRSVPDLPPMPQVMIKAREVMNNPRSNFKELADILEVDQAMAARVLKLSNSAYYGLAGKVSSVQHASVLLGYKTLGELVSMAGSSRLLGKTLTGYQMEAGDLWSHSLIVAFGSRAIASKKLPEMENDAFSAGLIHDAGKLVLDNYIGERTSLFNEYISNGEQTFLNAEKEILGFDHGEIAAEVCKTWKIPNSLITAIRYHHHPLRSHGDILTYIVHIADSLALMSGIGTGLDGMQYRIEAKVLESLKLDENMLTDVIHETIETVEKLRESMN
ncbi:MAG: HDOD domain-containing protein [Deltaproteobacteria bacterium]|nr:HDOD domain-containing protein [Deltaproteobacteria bacterium]